MINAESKLQVMRAATGSWSTDSIPFTHNIEAPLVRQVVILYIIGSELTNISARRVWIPCDRIYQSGERLSFI